MTEYRDYQLELRVGHKLVRLSAQVPEGPLSLVDFLPVVRAFTELTTDVATREAGVSGHAIRCGPGCGACCRQLVPIAPAEALALRHAISDLAPDHRERVLARFAKAVERLNSSGMVGQLVADCTPQVEFEGSRRDLGLAYFDLAIPCPFLEQESCSIHPSRPLACREYLVSSDPKGCSEPRADTVVVLELPRRLSSIFFKLGAEEAPGQPQWLPLTLALDESLFDAAAPGRAARPGPVLFERLVTLLASQPPIEELGA